MLYSLGKCISICCTCFTWQCEFQSWIQQHTNAEKEEFFAANNVISRLKTSRLQLCLRPYLFDFANHLQTYQLTSISNQRYDLRRNSQKVTKCDLTKNAEVAKSLFFHFCCWSDMANRTKIASIITCKTPLSKITSPINWLLHIIRKEVWKQSIRSNEHNTTTKCSNRRCIFPRT